MISWQKQTWCRCFFCCAAYVSLMTHFALSISICIRLYNAMRDAAHVSVCVGCFFIHLEILTRAFRHSFHFHFNTPVCKSILWILVSSMLCQEVKVKWLLFYFLLFLGSFPSHSFSISSIFRSIALFFHFGWTGFVAFLFRFLLLRFISLRHFTFFFHIQSSSKITWSNDN